MTHQNRSQESRWRTNAVTRRATSCHTQTKTPLLLCYESFTTSAHSNSSLQIEIWRKAVQQIFHPHTFESQSKGGCGRFIHGSDTPIQSDGPPTCNYDILTAVTFPPAVMTLSNVSTSLTPGSSVGSIAFLTQRLYVQSIYTRHMLHLSTLLCHARTQSSPHELTRH